MPRRNSGARLRFLEKRGCYYIVWTEGGRSRERSTGTADRRQAEIALAEFIHLRTRDAGPRDPSQVLVTDALADYAEEHGEETGSPWRIAAAIKALAPFWEGRTVAEVTRETCKAYHRFRGRSAGTIRRELGVLRASLNHGHKNGRLTRVVPLQLPDRPEPRDRWLTRKEAAGLLRAALREPRVRLHLPLFILVGLYGGARKEAILSLRWPQVDLDAGRIDFNTPGARRTKACLQSLTGKTGRDEIDEACKAGVGLFVAGGDASECLETTEEVLDQMAPLVHFGIMRDAAGAVGFGWDDRCGSAFIECGAQPVVVEGLVTDQRLKIEAGDQRLDTDAVVTLAGQEDKANEIAEGIDQSHDLGSETASRAAYGLILSPPFAPVPCWWTRTSVPSMRTYSKSGSSLRALKRRSQTPFCAQRQKRVYTVNHLPNASGRSRHGEPVRAIQRTASMKRRLSRPLLPGSPTLPDRCGAIRSHCASFNTNRIKAAPQFFSLESSFLPFGNPRL
jgi:hypothetical protein